MNKGKIFDLYTKRSKKETGLFRLFVSEQFENFESQQMQRKLFSKSESQKKLFSEFDKIYDYGEAVPKALCKEMLKLSEAEHNPNQFTVSQSIPDFFVEPFQLDENETEDLNSLYEARQSTEIIEILPDNALESQNYLAVESEQNEIANKLIDLDNESNVQFEQDLKEIITKQEQKKINRSEQLEDAEIVKQPNPEERKNRVRSDGKNEHAIFDKIAQSMRYANAYDLGEVILDNKFDQFDEEFEDKENQISTNNLLVETLKQKSNDLNHPIDIPGDEISKFPISTIKSNTSEQCNLIDRIVDIANQEWENWHPNGRKLMESAPTVRNYIEGYWRDGVQTQNWQYMSNESINNKKPWSSAFISWVFRLAGVTREHGFKFSLRHIDYIVEALRNREHNLEEKPFWFYDINDNSIIPQVGDIICKNRGQKHSYNSLKREFFDNGNHRITETTGKSHGDVVTEIKGNVLTAIGGNVGQTVFKSRFKLDSNKRILNPDDYEIFGIVRLINCDTLLTEKLPENLENFRNAVKSKVKNVLSFLMNLDNENEEKILDATLAARNILPSSIETIDEVIDLIFKMDTFVQSPKHFSISGKPNSCRKDYIYFDSSDQKIHFCPTYIKVDEKEYEHKLLIALCKMVLDTRTSSLSSNSFSKIPNQDSLNYTEAKKLEEFINHIFQISTHYHE